MRLPKGAWNTPEHQWPFKTALVRSMSLDVSLRKRQGVQRTTWARGVLRFVSGHPTPTIDCPCSTVYHNCRMERRKRAWNCCEPGVVLPEA
jgi:hypothetical protein